MAGIKNRMTTQNRQKTNAKQNCQRKRHHDHNKGSVFSLVYFFLIRKKRNNKILTTYLFFPIVPSYVPLLHSHLDLLTSHEIYIITHHLERLTMLVKLRARLGQCYARLRNGIIN